MAAHRFIVYLGGFLQRMGLISLLSYSKGFLEKKSVRVATLADLVHFRCCRYDITCIIRYNMYIIKI
jgi:hypothetical protein